MPQVIYRDSQIGRGPSPNIWGGQLLGQQFYDPSIGVAYWDDFTNVPPIVPLGTPAETFWGPYKAFANAGATITDDGIIGGGIKITEATDNEGVSFHTTTCPFQIINSGANSGKLLGEWRVRTSTIADNAHGFLMGFMDERTLTAILPIAANGTLADVNFIGFQRSEADGDKLDIVYRADGVAAVTHLADAVTLVANTYKKVGLVFTPTDRTMRFYDDGIEISGSSLTWPTAAGTSAPNDVRLGVVFAHLSAASSPGTTSLDWARAFQYTDTR